LLDEATEGTQGSGAYEEPAPATTAGYDRAPTTHDSSLSTSSEASSTFDESQTQSSDDPESSSNAAPTGYDEVP
jgi:hypothetical protein